MRILVVNDDGITSLGLARLAAIAAQFGEAWVVAPSEQCSGMSQRISVFGTLELRPEPTFAVEGVHAFSLSGTPADCVRVALAQILPERPDVVFSGINNGYNVGADIRYSGTVGAAAEAMANGIPAIAFSAGAEDLSIAESYLPAIVKELIAQPAPQGAIWNVNLPACAPEQVRGVLNDRFPSAWQYYKISVTPEMLSGGSMRLALSSTLQTEAEPSSDMAAVLANYISVGLVNCDPRYVLSV